MSKIPITIVTTNGIPVMPVDTNGMPAKRVDVEGLPVVIVANGGIPIVMDIPLTGGNYSLVDNGGGSISLSVDGTVKDTVDLATYFYTKAQSDTELDKKLNRNLDNITNLGTPRQVLRVDATGTRAVWSDENVVTIPEYTIRKNPDNTYNLLKDGTVVGDTIESSNIIDLTKLTVTYDDVTDIISFTYDTSTIATIDLSDFQIQIDDIVNNYNGLSDYVDTITNIILVDLTSTILAVRYLETQVEDLQAQIDSLVAAGGSNIYDLTTDGINTVNITENGTIKTSINLINTTALSWATPNLTFTVNGVTASLDLSALISGVQNAITGIDGDISTIQGDITLIQSQITDLLNLTEALALVQELQLIYLNNQVNNLQAQINTIVSSGGGSLVSIDTSTQGQVTLTIDGVDTIIKLELESITYDNTNQVINFNYPSGNTISFDISTPISTISDIGNRLTVVEGNQTDMQAQLNDIQAALTVIGQVAGVSLIGFILIGVLLNGRVTALETITTDLNSRVTTLESITVPTLIFIDNGDGTFTVNDGTNDIFTFNSNVDSIVLDLTNEQLIITKGTNIINVDLSALFALIETNSTDIEAIETEIADLISINQEFADEIIVIQEAIIINTLATILNRTELEDKANKTLNNVDVGTATAGQKLVVNDTNDGLAYVDDIVRTKIAVVEIPFSIVAPADDTYGAGIIKKDDIGIISVINGVISLPLGVYRIKVYLQAGTPETPNTPITILVQPYRHDGSNVLGPSYNTLTYIKTDMYGWVGAGGFAEILLDVPVDGGVSINRVWSEQSITGATMVYVVEKIG